MTNDFMCEDTRYVVQHEREADVLEHRAVLLLQDVLQVHVLVVTDLADVRVETGLPGAVAHLAGELGEVLGLELAAVDPLQPALAAHFPQVGSHRVVVDLRPGDQENLGLHAPHGTAHYSGSATFSGTRARHRSSTLPMIWWPDRPEAVRIDSGWNCTAHRPA